MVDNGIKNPGKVAQQLEVSEYVVKMLMPQQLGWLKLSIEKRNVFTALQNDELKVQELLFKIEEDKDLANVQKRIKEATDIMATSKEQRLTFTNKLKESLIDPAMEFEKRNSELLTYAMTCELELRKEENKKAQAGAALAKEEAQFEAHVKNEYIRIGTAYRMELSKLVTGAYTQALKGPIPPDQIPEYLEKTRQFLQEVKLPKFIKFERTLVTDERAKEIFKSVEAYAPDEDLQTALEDLDAKFELYEHDFKNAKKAIAAANAKQAEVEKRMEEEAEQETATNQLMVNVGTYSVDSPKGAKTTIKSRFVIVEENTEQWAAAVLSAFIKNWSTAKTMLKVKTWSKLTLMQMGKALADMKTERNELKFDNLKFEVSEK